MSIMWGAICVVAGMYLGSTTVGVAVVAKVTAIIKSIIKMFAVTNTISKP